MFYISVLTLDLIFDYSICTLHISKKYAITKKVPTEPNYPDSSPVELYSPLLILLELVIAHQQNDFAVMTAYEFDRKITESECVAELMKLYKKLTE